MNMTQQGGVAKEGFAYQVSVLITKVAVFDDSCFLFIEFSRKSVRFARPFNHLMRRRK